MTTLTKGGLTITPTMVLGYTATSESASTSHQILGARASAVTLGWDGLRTGTLRLGFVSRALAWQAYNAHTAPGVWTFVDTDNEETAMKYVRKGGMSIELEDETRNGWIVSIGYEEVL